MSAVAAWEAAKPDEDVLQLQVQVPGVFPHAPRGRSGAALVAVAATLPHLNGRLILFGSFYSCRPDTV